MSGWPIRWNVPLSEGDQAISKCWVVVPALKPRMTPLPVKARAPSIIRVASPWPRGWAADHVRNEGPELTRYSSWLFATWVWYVTMKCPVRSRTMSGEAALVAITWGGVHCARSLLVDEATSHRTCGAALVALM